MSRFILTLCTAGIFAGLATAGRAAEPTLTSEVHELRRDIQTQAKKIDTLAEQVARLTQAVEERSRLSAAPQPATVPEIPKTSSSPSSPPPASEIPRAEAVASPNQHIVEKGETLTSIAKRFNISLSDLQRLNKITNDRKLQIGQTLVIPVPKPPETPAEKKDTP